MLGLDLDFGSRGVVCVGIREGRGVTVGVGGVDGIVSRYTPIRTNIRSVRYSGENEPKNVVKQP